MKYEYVFEVEAPDMLGIKTALRAKLRALAGDEADTADVVSCRVSDIVRDGTGRVVIYRAEVQAAMGS